MRVGCALSMPRSSRLRTRPLSRSRKPHQRWTSRPVPLLPTTIFVAPGAEASMNAMAPPSTDPIDALLIRAWDRYHDNDLDGARAAVEEIWAQLTPDHADVVQVVTLRAHIQILDKQPREALGTIGQALDWGIHHPNIDMLQGVIVENAGMTSLEREHQQTCLERAEAAFLACVTHDAKISARDNSARRHDLGGKHPSRDRSPHPRGRRRCPTGVRGRPRVGPGARRGDDRADGVLARIW